MLQRRLLLKRIIIEKDSYYDSVFLMLINRDVKKIEGVKDAVVSMGTEMNIDLLKSIGLSSPEVEGATANDLIIAVDAESEETADRACAAVEDLLKKKKSTMEDGGEYRPASLETAINMMADANLAIISLPGQYAAREVRKALSRELHVMLFSDNVSLEDEIELKKLAVEKGLLMMGPDCGTAIINGKPLCFANVVRDGDIGIVAASGTGLQEVFCCIDNLGSGVTQAIGTGGRDLKNTGVGGMMMLLGIEALEKDPRTKVIVVISKPPAPEVADKVIARLKETGKPVVIHFIGLEVKEQEHNLYFAGNLEETAGLAVSLSKGEAYKPRVFTVPEEKVREIVAKERAGMSSEQKYLRGLYTGGTLADEAMILFDSEVGGIYSNNQVKEELVPKNPHVSQEHTIVDLGDDVFTVGRPHPMIDPSIREERIVREMEDPEVALLLLDIVLGYGSHDDPAGAILDSLKEAREKARQRGGYLAIIASITGTEGDFQNMAEQQKKLESIGCVVMPSNYQASMLALKIIRKVV